MKPFLQYLAEEIASRYGDDPGKICVVLPNRRAGLYLSKYLAKTLRKTIWSPVIYSMEDFISEISGYSIIDQAGLLFEFYEVYRRLTGDKAQEFEVFADWAQVLLKDFDEIDKYLVEPEKIFNYLSAARALTVWNLDERPLTDQEKQYLEFYRSFLDFYQALRAHLEAGKAVYQGLAYRLAAGRMISHQPDLPFTKIFFAGLNALSLSEEQIIGALFDLGKAEVFWDADRYYVADERQEAGTFIRQYQHRWTAGKQVQFEDHLSATDKFIRVYGIPGSTGQAQKAGQIVRELQSGNQQPDTTAIVLADEKLLLPVLYALPEDYGPVNVTMGYPLRFTPAYQWVIQYLFLYENAEKFEKQRNHASRQFYTKDILKILVHPYFYLFNEDQSVIPANEVMNERLSARNRVFMSANEILKLDDQGMEPFRLLIREILNAGEKIPALLDSLTRTLEMIRDRMILLNRHQAGSYDIDLEYLFHLSRLIRKCKTLIAERPYLSSVKSLRHIIVQLLDASKLPFSGEPLQGLQVMGVLETRAVDFENLIILSVNEGILPSGRLPNSFIPFDIKNEFGLPTFRQKDAVFAYHFYHMVQRATHIFILYDTEGDQIKGGEKSRFITQIGYELTRVNAKIRFSEQLLRPGSPAGKGPKIIRREKNPEILAALKKRSENGFSPTALISYINCSLRFYYEEILGVKEDNATEGTIEANTMGTVIHDVLQRVYTPFLEKSIDPGVLSGLLDSTESLVKEAFAKHFSEGDIAHGKNHLIFKASVFLVDQFIQNEIDTLSEHPSFNVDILSLEEMLADELTIQFDRQETKVRIKGKTDRIDQTGNLVRIIDYKSGVVNSSELNIKDWDSLMIDPGLSKAFQLLVYAWLYLKKHGRNGKDIQSGNFSLRKASSGFMSVKLPTGQVINEETMNIFENLLKGLIGQIMDPAQAFVQTEDTRRCKNCPFTGICTR